MQVSKQQKERAEGVNVSKKVEEVICRQEKTDEEARKKLCKYSKGSETKSTENN